MRIKREEKTSLYKGVSLKGKKWLARYKRIRIGLFDTEEEAARAYNKTSPFKNQLSDVLICIECGETKPLEDFYEHRNGHITTGRQSLCKECHKTYASINAELTRIGLPKNEESLSYLKNKRIFTLINNNIITEDEARDLYNFASTFRCFSIRVKEQKISFA